MNRNKDTSSDSGREETSYGRAGVGRAVKDGGAEGLRPDSNSARALDD